MAGNFWTSSHCNLWLLEPSELSYLEKTTFQILTKKEQEFYKIFIADIALLLGKRLNLRQQIIATATVYSRRFYLKNNLDSCSPLLLVPTALYLACKIEEYGVLSLRNLVSVVQNLARTEFSYLYLDYCILTTQHILDCEFYLLEELNCHLIVYHPYRLLCFYCESLKVKEVIEISWYIVNDTYRSDIFLNYPPHMIALTAIYLSCILVGSIDKEEVRERFSDLSIEFEKEVT
ncbi:cyclin-C-like isoform X2 [Zophobas morio]|uniref:cyclin-C-like isoform X2 n=1 Tax=Zophobas morio TaxID=2755281 RepID=UPI0030831447